MARARHFTKGGNTTIVFPPGGQIGPETENLLTLNNFQKTGLNFSNCYRKAYWNEEQRKQADQAGEHIAACYNTGRKEYCREILTRQRVRHG